MVNDIMKDVEDRMDKCIKNLEREYLTIRTGRANPAILDSVKVESYGTLMPLNQVATVSCPEPRLIMVQPWDKSNISAIEKAILKADLSLNPASDGNVIRIQIPELTEERRKELVKVAHKYAEAARIAIRHVRRDGLDVVKKLEKDHAVSKDDHERMSDEIQKLTDQMIREVDQMLASKEKEILTV